MKFIVEFSPLARSHLKGFRKRDQQIILDAIEASLMRQPDKRTRNRKLLEENPLAPWELRVGPFRVFYDIMGDEATVLIMAIGRKIHNVLLIGGEEIQL
jgi:mRNA interferase RelE/StbE